MKTNYSDSLIAKALEKLNMSELLEHGGNVPVRATKDITLAYIDLYIPKGTLFFITSLVWSVLSKKPRFELRFAFPDTDDVDEERGLTEYYLPCRINTNTYEITSCADVPLTEILEKVDGETGELMKALYFKHCEFSENRCKHDNKYSDVLDVLKIITGISLCAGFVSVMIALVASSPIRTISTILGVIFGVILLVSTGLLLNMLCMRDYEKSGDAQMIRGQMACLCKTIAEKEQCLNDL